MSLADLQMPRQHRAGDKMDILLAGDLKNPEWQWLDYPSASGHLEHYGFPRTTLTDDQPYLQMERLAGLHDEKLDLKTILHNPACAAVTVQATVTIVPKEGKGTPVIDERKVLTIPAKGTVRFDVEKAFPGLKDAHRLSIAVTRTDTSTAPPVYEYACEFSGTDKSYLKAEPRDIVFEAGVRFNPANGKTEVFGDTLDARIPAGSKPAGLTYAIEKDGTAVASGKITQCAHYIYNDIVALPAVAPGKYNVTLSLVDADGQPLVTRSDIRFEKKDESREFAHWWNNRYGETRKVLPPFEPLVVEGPKVRCTRRVYQLDGLGLPRQIESNGGNVLTAPARIVLTVAGKPHAVPTEGTVQFTDRQDWRLEFTGKSEAAGVAFTVQGWMEQDGLVNLEVTFAPQTAAVPIDDLRVEWPIDDSLGSWMSCIGGVGGNYAPRTIDKVPAGQGQVWDTLTGIGKAGSRMLVGNWENNFWVGNDTRGLCWFGDSDQGWVPHDATPAHSLAREGKAVILRNHIINLPKGEGPFTLDAPRTIHLQYNATPFRHFAKGWRLTQVSAANGFSYPEYKYNEKEKKEYFSLLSMPSQDVNEWPYYYAKYKKRAEQAAQEHGWNTIGPRLGFFLTNQIALRGYMDKTLEPGLYGYFHADWMPGLESLNSTYRDYCAYLMHRQIREGGVTHFYYDISFTQSTANLVAGFGYRLPDGRVQPGSMDGPLREWYKRVWALMAENGLYPGGVSGHATHSIPLRALPFADAMLDSEYPMKDPVTVYTKDAMIAMSCPHNFGVNISHLGFMLPEWASMHDTGIGGSGYPLNSVPFRHFGIAAGDVTFLGHWRNQAVIKPADPGVLATIWKRPGKAIIQVLNYGLDPEGQEKSRSARLTLNLAALGVPAGAKPGQVRVQEILPGEGRISRQSKIFAWYQALPDSRRWPNDEDPKVRPAASPTLDVATGVVDGVELFYHDSRYLLVTWDEELKSVPEGLFDESDMTKALAWGINRPETVALDAAATSAAVGNANPAVQVRAWRRPGTVMLRVANTSNQALAAELMLDLDKLGVKVPKLWTAYTQCLGGDLDPRSGKTTVKLQPGEVKAVWIDTYGG